jgi:hypothetical protein
MMSAPQIIAILFMFFVIPYCSVAREFISVIISFDLLRKKRIMMEDVNASNVRDRWTRC